MVLRCNGSSQEEILDSALNRVTEEALNSSFNSVPSINNNPFLVKGTGDKRADLLVTFSLLIHGYSSYVNGVEQLVKQIDGVKRVKSDGNSIKLEVTGMVDPLKVQQLVECKTKKKVELIIPSANVEGDKDKNQGSEEKQKNLKKIMQRNGMANMNTEESIFVLKIKLCCDSCNRKLRKILKLKGLETISMDVDKDLVKAKGAVDMTAVESYIKNELKKDVVVIFPAEVLIPTKKDDSTAYKKEKDACIPRKNDKNAEGEATNKKDKGCNATSRKNKGSNATSDGKYRGSTVTVDGKFKGTGAVYEKTKGIAAVDVKDKGSTEIDEKSKGSATVIDKCKDKKNDKDYAVNDEKGKGGSKDAVEKTFGGVRTDSGEGDGGATRKEKAKTSNKIHHYNDDYYFPGTHSNGYDQIFSDENPHSCYIM